MQSQLEQGGTLEVIAAGRRAIVRRNDGHPDGYPFIYHEPGGNSFWGFLLRA